MSNVYKMSEFNGRRSSSLKESIRRRESAESRSINSQCDGNWRQNWYEKINANINYWKEHGKLPSNTDMAKVNGLNPELQRGRHHDYR